ncbi:MAG: hypothetical protein JXR83_17805 [Deltaproteobacteria bacterium]|nr:hypothetical protein [Deltaproteobacteria bacterium]
MPARRGEEARSQGVAAVAGRESRDDGKADFKARRVKPGESFASIASALFGDKRAALLLQDLNPDARRQGAALAADQALRIPSRDYVARWATRMGFALARRSEGSATRRRRWQAFAQPAARPRSRGGEIAALAASVDFDRLVDGVAALDTAGRGFEIWQAMARIGDDAVRQALGATPASELEASIEHTRARVAIRGALASQVQKVVARCCADLFDRLATAAEQTLRRPERVARLLVALGSLAPGRSQELLTAMGLPPDLAATTVARLPALARARRAANGFAAAPTSARTEIAAIARAQGVAIDSVDVETLVEQAAISTAARDRLAVLAAGLDAPAADLARLLKPLATALRSVAKALAAAATDRAQVPLLVHTAREIAVAVERARRELGITRSDSSAARALDELLGRAAGTPAPLVQFALRLPRLFGSALVDVDAAALERGLAALVGASAVPEAERGPALQRLAAADLRARMAVAERATTDRRCDAAALGRTAAALARSSLLSGVLAAAAAPRKKRLHQAWLARFTTGEASARPLDAAALAADARGWLDGAAELRELFPDAALRASRALEFTRRHPEFFGELTAQLPAPLPPAGRRRQAAAAVGLIAAAYAVERAHALRSPAEAAGELARAIRESGGAILDIAEQQLAALCGDDPRGRRPPPPRRE